MIWARNVPWKKMTGKLIKSFLVWKSKWVKNIRGHSKQSKQDNETEAWRGWVPCPNFCKSGTILKLKVYLKKKKKRKDDSKKRNLKAQTADLRAMESYSQAFTLNQGITDIWPAGFQNCYFWNTSDFLCHPIPPFLGRNVHSSHPMPVSQLYVGCGKQTSCFFSFISKEELNFSWGFSCGIQDLLVAACRF